MFNMHNSDKDTKVLFICRKRNSVYGISIGLVNSAQFVANFLVSQGIDSKVVTVIDSNGIDKEVHDYKPTHVIIHALWVPPYKLEELSNKYKNIEWQIRIHSKVPFIAHEGMAMEWLTEYYTIQKANTNIVITANSPEFKDAIEKSLHESVEYLPNLYMPSYPAPDRISHEGNFINIGCFGAIRPFKNHLLQAMAAMAFGDKIKKDVYFHINCDRSEQNGQSVLKNLKALFAASPNHKLIEVKWQEHKEFLNTVATMDMGMQISMSETYNIVAADFVYVGIPMIVSPEINWMPWYTKADFYDIKDMVKVLSTVYRTWNPICRWANKRYLESDNKKAGKIWMKYLS